MSMPLTSAAAYRPMPATAEDGRDGASQLEADEALARQLQRAEMEGMGTPLILGNGRGSEGAASMNSEARQTRMNALDHAQREVRSSAHVAFGAVVLVNVPQIVAAVVVLSLYWNDHVCSLEETMKWRTYALIAAARMTLYISSVTALYLLNGRLSPHTQIMRALAHARYGLDAFGLIWFVVGNMWLFGGSPEVCAHPNRSPLYKLCVAMVFINYAQLCLPCVVVIFMLPVLCFCLPCLIRILARIQDPMRGKGASVNAINRLPLMRYRQMAPQGASTNSSSSSSAVAGSGRPSVSSVGESNSSCCAICISEYSGDDECRLLPCTHYFHKQCVDEWLKVNATCPTCRASILSEQEAAAQQAGGYGTVGGVGGAPAGRTGGGLRSGADTLV